MLVLLFLPVVTACSHIFIDKNQQTAFKQQQNMLARWPARNNAHNSRADHWSAMSLHIDWVEKCQVIAIMGVLKCAK